MNVEALIETTLQLALRGRGEVEPNPRVGALALQDGMVVGEGWHQYYGGRHAEIEALAAARAAGASADTIVVNLEPCSSARGALGKKTPPCTAELIAAGIRKVVVGMQDPDPRHRGHGLAALEEAGIEVVEGVLTKRCREINKPFARWLALDRPWTIAKWAMTLDGKTAAPTGEARWISGMAARVLVHQLRARVDAVVVGFRTARIDDPELTVRHVEGPQPVRVLVDPHGEIEDSSHLLSTARQLPLWVIVHQDIDPLRSERLQELGATVIPVPPAEQGRRLHLARAWRELRQRGVRRVMLEGGGGLTAQLLAWNCVDQVMAFVAPKMIGGQRAPTPVGGGGKPFMAEAWRVDEMFWQPVGDDLMVGAFVE